MRVHAREQIVRALQDALKSALPTLEGRVYRKGAIGVRDFPFAVVTAGSTRTETQASNTRKAGRLQTNETTIVVEFHVEISQPDEDQPEPDLMDAISEIAMDVEAAMNGFGSSLGIVDFEKTADTGVTDPALGEGGILVSQALSYSVTYRTLEGAADKIF